MGKSDIQPIFKLKISAKGPLGSKFAGLAGGALEQLLALNKLDEIYARVCHEKDTLLFLKKVLAEFRVGCRVAPGDLARVPQSGPTVVVANHPFGGIEGIVLARLLLEIRPDVKIMANHLLSRIPELRDVFIFVDPFEGKNSIRSNLKPLKEAIRWVGQGGLLAIFPAGEVAHLDLKSRAVIDPEWSRVVARIVSKTKASVVPAFFGGANGSLFQVMGLVHPRLRTALLPRELLNKADKELELRLGGPISPQHLAGFEDTKAMTAYLRWRTYSLGAVPKKMVKGASEWRPARRQAPAPLAKALPRGLIAADVAALAPEQTLVTSGKYRIIHALKKDLPALIQEIGRLREITFREVGEGTCKPLDLDEFDEYYTHLFLWNDAKQELVGAYRLGRADEIVRDHGPSGLYTSTLFKYKKAWFDQLGSSLELGRSFVRKEYQRSYSSLLLLWKGIGTFIQKNPRYRYIFGPVSVSNSYQPLSRLLMLDYVTINHSSDLSWLVKPRKPARLKFRKGMDYRAFVENMPGPEELSEVISDIEGQDLGVPVLLRHYLSLSAKAVGWNVDPDFGQALDCLMLVDLMETDPRTLNHYMGPEGYRKFMDYHTKNGGDISEAA